LPGVWSDAARFGKWELLSALAGYQQYNISVFRHSIGDSQIPLTVRVKISRIGDGAWHPRMPRPFRLLSDGSRKWRRGSGTQTTSCSTGLAMMCCGRPVGSVMVVVSGLMPRL